MAKGMVLSNEMVMMVVISILIPTVLLIGSLLYVAFFATAFNLLQKIVVLLVALIVSLVAESLLWVICASKKGLMALKKPK